MHKKRLPRSCYGIDIDFALIEKSPPGIVAILDYKRPGDKVTFSEVIAYNALAQHWWVFIVEGQDPEKGPFVARQYLDGDWRPDVPVVRYGQEYHLETWADFGAWEKWLRSQYRRRSCGDVA